MSARATTFAQSFFHGTKASLQAGDLLRADIASNYAAREKALHVYFSATLDAAVWGAELAVGEVPGRIYVVEPTGAYEDDPTDKRFPGNATKSYRSSGPVRILGEVVGWVGTQAKTSNACARILRSSRKRKRRRGESFAPRLGSTPTLRVWVTNGPARSNPPICTRHW